MTEAARSTRAAQAIAHLPEHDPALAALAIWCRILDGEGPTATRGQAILIGPEFATLPLREQIALLGHHILHIALRHAGRMGAMAMRRGGLFDAERFNLGADALVNSVLLAGGHALPRPAVTLEDLARDVLRVPPQDVTLAGWDVERLYVALESAAQGGGQAERDYMAAKAFQPDLDADRSPAERGTQAEWQAHLTRAMQMAASAGRGIGKGLQGLGDIPASETPWELHLRRLAAKALLETPRVTHSRPRRRWIGAEAEARRRGAPVPVFEPAQMRDQRQPRIVVGVDASGSITKAQLAVFAGEIARLARQAQAELHVLWFDEVVFDAQMMRRAQVEPLLEALQVRRDGGTSFIDVLDRAAALDPSLVVLLTDLDGPMGRAPGCPVVWASAEAAPPSPPFGTVLSLSR